MDLCVLACPGNLSDACSSNGVCDDGKSGSGHCQCSANFTGTACEKCISGKYGTNCTNGKCANRIVILVQRLQSNGCFTHRDLSARCVVKSVGDHRNKKVFQNSVALHNHFADECELP